MTLVSLLINCIVAVAPPAGFQEALSVRNFDSAMELAGDSDSLKAVVFMQSGSFAPAAVLFERVLNDAPSPGTFAELWKTIALSADHYPELPAGEFRTQLDHFGGEFRWEAGNFLSLLETAEILGDSVTFDSLATVLVMEHPGSREASVVIGWDFYDRLYPVWNDDSAKVPVLEGFLEDWGDRSHLWRSRAHRYILASVLETADSLQWRDYHGQWAESCPWDPRVYLTGSALLIDRDSSFSEALSMAERGIHLIDQGYVQEEMPREEWWITGPALDMGLRFRRLIAMSGMGMDSMALLQLNSLLEEPDYELNDYHTRASLYWLKGRLCIQAADTASALRAWTEAVILGDFANRWSGRSLSRMDSLMKDKVSSRQWAAEALDYTGPVFTDATYMLDPDSTVQGRRVSWLDWNGDGCSDLFTGNRLYLNNGGGSFTDITEEVGLENCRGTGGVWGDLNRDGFPDLVTSGFPVQVFLSRGERLEEADGNYGIENTEGRIEGAALLDWNGDGLLDLYLAGYEAAGNMGSGTADCFFLGGDAGFQEAGDSLGMVPFLGLDLCGRGVSPCDFDCDGDMDIFVSNYRLQENFLWKNEDGTAVNAALELGVAGNETEGWWGHTIGSAWGDVDGDGDWDLFCANLAHPRYIGFSDRSELLINENTEFTDIRLDSGIRFEETHSHPLWGDFNNDGLLDLYVTSVYEDRRSFLYLNRGGGRFKDVTWLSGTRVFNGWGAAAADFDLDGRLDLAVSSGEGVKLFRNVSEDGYWALVQVDPPEGCNPSGLGCRVVLRQDSLEYSRQVDGGSGTTCQNGPVLHFGLPSSSDIKLELYIPGDPDPVAEASATPGNLVKLEADI